jgi:membrane-anchored protein YejM (alkaline phosphatase superfamily)
LNASSGNDDITWLNNYFSSITPTNKNQYTGMFEGYNMIFITAEGFSKYLISEELTPTLYRLSNEGFVFNNYYTPLHYTSTSGGEFQNLTGLYPKNGNPISMTD